VQKPTFRICVAVMCILQMALGNRSDIDLLVSCIRNSVIITNDETGKCEVVPPPPADEICDIAKLMEMYVLVLLPFINFFKCLCFPKVNA